MLNKSKDETGLPRIQSQKRVHTAFDRKDSSRDALSNNAQPNNRQLKRTLSAVNNCRAVKYQTAGIMYTKKLQQLQKQNALIEKETKIIQQQIKQLRKSNQKLNKGQQKSEGQTFLSQANKTSQSKISLRKNINMNDQRSLINQIKISQNKIQILRKKIDEQQQKNFKMRREVDAVRKQITTLKSVNRNLQNSLHKTNQEFNQFSQLSKTLQQQIANKNSLMHRTKIQSQHKKAQIIKQYDKILKQLQKQLNEQKTNNKTASQTTSNALYVTQFGEEMKQATLKTVGGGKFHLAMSRKSKANMSNQISAVKARLQRYQKQFDELQNQTGTRNAEEAVKQFQDKYDQNFKYYKYINELHASLQEKQKQNQQLTKYKNQILQQVEPKASNTKFQEIIQIQNSIQLLKQQKAKFVFASNQHQLIVKRLKSIIKQFYSKVDMGHSIQQSDINQQNITDFLVLIKQRCSQLDGKFDEQFDRLDLQQFHNQADLTQMLQNVRKQCHQQNAEQKSERLMSRQQFLKSRDALFKKRQTPRKTVYKK